jgi:hypothetical protein
MARNHPISGHFCLILGRFRQKMQEYHGISEFDLLTLAASPGKGKLFKTKTFY